MTHATGQVQPPPYLLCSHTTQEGTVAGQLGPRVQRELANNLGLDRLHLEGYRGVYNN